MAKRKSISKKLRFEVFKRDHFKCQYCGAETPNVVLVIDHIIPVALNGTNEIENLITSCNDCNSGKSDKPLAMCPKSTLMEREELKERREQMANYTKWQQELREAKLKIVNRIGVHWFNHILPEKDHNKYTFAARRQTSIKTFLSRGLTELDITDAVEITMARFQPESVYRDEQAFKYFCGICWSMIREKEEANNASF